MNARNPTNVFLGLPKRQLREAIQKLKTLPVTKEVSILLRQLQSAMKTILVLLFLLSSAFGQTTHNATISFTASPDTPTSNIYRADGTCPLTPPPTGQVKLNALPISGTSYTDSTVSVAKTYCYTVKAVLNGLESKDSNMVTATIPLAPASSVTVIAQ